MLGIKSIDITGSEFYMLLASVKLNQYIYELKEVILLPYFYLSIDIS
jgi:hypothetical protein